MLAPRCSKACMASVCLNLHAHSTENSKIGPVPMCGEGILCTTCRGRPHIMPNTKPIFNKIFIPHSQGAFAVSFCIHNKSSKFHFMYSESMPSELNPCPLPFFFVSFGNIEFPTEQTTLTGTHCERSSWSRLLPPPPLMNAHPFGLKKRDEGLSHIHIFAFSQRGMNWWAEMGTC
jgi:hypothetical protein